jgi:hypothetical protein
MSKLGTFQYIDTEKLKKKFEVTNILEKPNILDDYYKNTLKDYSPEPATFAYEEVRKNNDSIGKLNTHYYGRRNDKEPFQNDLFLGFTDKDPRSIHSGPLMGKYQEQIWNRKDDYKYSFKDDSDNAIPTSGISESQMQKNKKSTYIGFKERYKNYEESTDAWTPGYLPIYSDMSRVYLHDVDDTLPDLTKIKDLSNRRDIINEISMSSLPKGWDSVPDQKYKIAKYSKLLSQMNVKDINILKNKNEQEKDDKQKNLDAEQELLKQLVLLTEHYKDKKRSNFANQDINYKISKVDQNRSINKNPEFFKNNELLTTETDDKKNKLSDILNSKLFSAKQYETLNEILHKSLASNKVSKFNNKDNVLINPKQQTKDILLTEILRQVVKSNNENFLNKGNNKEDNNKASKISFLKNINSEFLYNNNDIDKNSIQKNNNTYEIMNYSNIASQFTNNYDSVQTSIENKLQNFNNEQINHHRKPNHQSNDALHTDDFENDIIFTDSGSKDRKLGIHGSKYLFREKRTEQSMIDNSINDNSGFKLKNNIFRSKK